MHREQHTGVQSFRVVDPDPEMPVLLTPDQFRLESGRLIPTPPTSERHVFDGHLSDLRRKRISGQVVDCDVDIRCERQSLMTAPVVRSRRRVAASFPDLEHGATGGSIISVDPTWGSKIVSLKSDSGVPAYGLNEAPARNDVSVSRSMNVMNNVVSETLTTIYRPPVQSIPIYTTSNPYSYAYVNTNDVASTHTEVDRFDRRDYISSDRRPTVLADSSLDDDTDNENRPERKLQYAAKTPRRPKPYEQSRSKRHDTVQWDENTLPKYRDSPEIQQLRGQFEQYSQVLQSISNRVDDLADTVTISTNENTTVKPQESDSTNRLVDQMKALIDTVSKKRKVRKTELSTFEQSSASETETESAPQRHLIRPMKFDGIGSFETFMAHFRNCATHNRWNQTEQLSWLKNSLIKNAGQVLWDSSPETTDTLSKLIEMLTNRFGSSKQTDKHRMELRYRKRRPNESLSDLHQDVSRLMALAHPQLPSASRETIACDYYIDNL